MDGISAWVVWLVAAAILFIIEIIGGTVALLCLGAGCLVAAVVAALGLTVVVQFLTAAVVTVLVFLLAGPAIRNFYHKSKDVRHHISNMDALIGRTGRVTVQITDKYTDGGRVQIDGDSWQAFSTSPDVPLSVGSTVRVESYDSIVLHVRPAKSPN